MKNLNIYIIMIIYFVLTFFLERIIGNVIGYIIPMVLLVISLYIHFTEGDNHGRFPRNKEYIKKMIIIMLLYVIIYFFLGILFGFTKSPYSHNIIILLKNIWRIIIPVIMLEYIRSFTVCTNSNNKFIIITFTLLLFVIELNLNTFIKNISISEDTFKYVSQTVIPLFATEMLCTYLCLKGSYKLSLPYRIALNAITIFSPVFPDIDWFASGIIGVLFPATIFLLYKYDYQKKNRRISRRDLKKQNPIVYVPIFIILIIFGAFMLGLFKYEPIAIVSNSMDPVFNRGDVVILRKVNKTNLNKLKKYDIIIYSIDKQLVAHRIINIKEEKEELYFKTKGDANISSDLKWVKENQIVGKYEFHIKYVGYPSVWLNDIFKKQNPKVEIK